ncbi:MAG: thioesterase, partial [Actinobacteria bacterium]|nr:thioesterase [Actinomycetota bacterium]NIX49624.1 thioesterase [Actinomycetota bacterium]
MEEGDGAAALGSGDVPVLGTPRLVALAEEATVAAVGPVLGSAETSVGVRVEIDHLRATPIGDTVTVDAMLSHVDGRRLTFEIGATDSGGTVARGKVVRVVVDRE